MPDIHENQHERFYDGDDQLFDVDVEIKADTPRKVAGDGVTAVERIRQAVRKEAQHIQDELDTDGEIGDA